MGVIPAFPFHQSALRRMHGGAVDASDWASDWASERACERASEARQRRALTSLPASLACLHQAGHAPDRLLAAARIGAALGIAPEQVMLREGWIGEHEYYRTLAKWLGLTFVDEPFAPGHGAHYPQSIVAGIAPRADGAWICAPEGRRIETLAFFRRRASPVRITITTPSNLRRSVETAFAVESAQAASRDLDRRDSDASAKARVSAPQIACAAMLLAIIATALTGAGAINLAASAIIGAIIAASIGLRLLATFAGSSSHRDEGPALPDELLPTYTIIAALHREAAVAGKLVAALDALDYPRARLDIKIVIEEGDEETREALERLDLPLRYQIIVAPHGQPRTKPRALNIALAQARGSLVTVYDAEDEPEPDQLRKAAAAFAALPARIGCLQARLAIDNFADGWLARLFAIEYAALFEAVNPGLSRLDAPVALGGTSNHFRIEALRDAGGWDAWNVTEDIDLGFRLARHGYGVGALNSSTHEEAPARLRAWFNQRRRWFKGWMQTLITHTRAPSRLIAEAGPARAAAAILLVCGALIGPMFGPAFAVALVASAVSGDLFETPGPAGLAAAAFWCLVCAGGLAAALWPAIVGLKRQGLLRLMLWAPLLPVYWVLLSAAAWWALVDLVRSPFHWAKTDHGLARTSRRRREAQERGALKAPR
ncbi:MAG: glycosyltransferase [Beijerinckiaceae bacterium]|nr:glycosyltransferase [Beijerinckiaceae bacterium]